MKKFYVLYKTPTAVIDEWMKLPEEERKTQMKDMETEWNQWMAKHADILKETQGLGKPKNVTASGVTDARNDLMMYSIAEADNAEVLAEMFKDHPHFKIPESSIEIMPINPLPPTQ